jgi:aryl-alcohol dehydrogenase-like predicted oxidoreductase
MKYRYLGHSGLLVSRVCLGTMTFGMEGWGCDRDTALAITHKFLEAGGNFIDTADMYSQGVSEEMLGAAVKDHPRDDLVRSGKVRYLGCSNFFGWQIVKANALAERQGLTRLVSAQHLYNLLRRDVEREILGACADQGLGLMCWSPLASGMLTGKYDQSAGPAKQSRVGLRADIDVPRYWNEASFRIIEEVKQVAAETGKTPAQVALAWPLVDRRVACVIVGVRTVEQVTASLVAGDWDLPDEQYSRLANVIPFDLGYPQQWMDTTWSSIAGGEEFAPWKSTRRRMGSE